MILEKDLVIGKKFFIHEKENDKDKLINSTRSLRIIGMYYVGNNGDSNWITENDMMLNVKKIIQFSLQPYYTFSNYTNYESHADDFIREFNEDQKLMPEFRKYSIDTSV